VGLACGFVNPLGGLAGLLASLSLPFGCAAVSAFVGNALAVEYHEVDRSRVWISPFPGPAVKFERRFGIMSRQIQSNGLEGTPKYKWDPVPYVTAEFRFDYRTKGAFFGGRLWLVCANFVDSQRYRQSCMTESYSIKIDSHPTFYGRLWPRYRWY
jgi:hypothetical protein